MTPLRLLAKVGRAAADSAEFHQLAWAARSAGQKEELGRGKRCPRPQACGNGRLGDSIGVGGAKRAAARVGTWRHEAREAREP